jgi:hypothetical protein
MEDGGDTENQKAETKKHNMNHIQMQEACAQLPSEIRGQLLQHARVGRGIAMRALDIEHDETFKKIVDATPDLAHRLPGEGKTRYRSSVICQLLISFRCAAKGEKVKKC